MPLTDNYIFERDENVTRKPVSYKKRFGITIAADLYRLGGHDDGRPGESDDLRLGHLTQERLATSDDREARTSGGYWRHQRPRRVSPPRSTTSSPKTTCWRRSLVSPPPR